jgi:hypothetical protein
VTVAPPAPQTQVRVTSVTVGRHADFDRVVFALSGPTLGYDVKYVPRLVEDPSGRPLALAGSAVLSIAMRQTDWIAHPSPHTNLTPGFPGLRQVRFAGEFEAVVSYGIGQSSKAGFRVFRLTGPDRIVVDVKHPASATAQPGTRPGAGAVSAPPAASTGGTTGTGTGQSTGDGGLAGTGFSIAPLVWASLGILAAGAAVLALVRRRAIS